MVGFGVYALGKPARDRKSSPHKAFREFEGVFATLRAGIASPDDSELRFAQNLRIAVDVERDRTVAARQQQRRETLVVEGTEMMPRVLEPATLDGCWDRVSLREKRTNARRQPGLLAYGRGSGQSRLRGS